MEKLRPKLEEQRERLEMDLGRGGAGSQRALSLTAFHPPCQTSAFSLKAGMSRKRQFSF